MGPGAFQYFTQIKTPRNDSGDFAISVQKDSPAECLNEKYLRIPYKSLTNYLLSAFFVIIHSVNRVITTPTDTPNAIINQKPALLGLHSILE